MSKPPEQPQPTRDRPGVTGTVERVTFHNDETGFCVLKILVGGRKSLVTVVGSLPQVVPGETIIAQGEWITDRQHGRQFKAESLKVSPPDSLEGIEKFLGSGLIKGIGPVYAAKLVSKFGKEVFDIIERESARLEEVEGVGRTRRQLIKEGWNEAREIRAIMAFLMANGISTARAFRIYKCYGDQAIPTVKRDPYCLARDIKGIGFKSADAVAMKMGISADSELRARAGIEHVLQEITSNGHCACPVDELIEQSVSILNIDRPVIEQALAHALSERRLVRDEIAGETLIYLSVLHENEVSLARRLKSLFQGRHPSPPIDIEKAIAWAEQKIGISLAPAQRNAVAGALKHKVSVITGGPGVGKTTLIKAVIKILLAKKVNVRLCAPTGRAAKRLNESTGLEATTIHRLLEFEPGRGQFKFNSKSPLEGDVFIVDESSMLDLPLACSLVKALPRHSALVLVGDVDQLPSVGPGSVLKDIIRSECFPVAHLNEIFRQAEGSAIVVNAHAINHGKPPVSGTPGSGSDFFIMEENDPERAVDIILKLVHRQIPGKMKVSPIQDIQVLAPMIRGSLGARNLNERLQDTLNPNGDVLERFGTKFRERDKVMQLENNYDKDVYNGDVGIVFRIEVDEQQMVVRFGDRFIRYDFNELDELAPAYAITVHKSQGSEYPCVVIPVHTQHYMMLQRNLLYTAITRGRKLVILVGSKKAIDMAVNRHDVMQRKTALCHRLKQGDENLSLENEEFPADKINQQ
ncbi:MAG TPA: ATP-dependent RecD-like DNA helicase [Kiritimatiellia bacterium]|nr:ATP-dependent RecD-like DNA helicase [Kiritimatiellia bacterium]